jgi:hypothetical protein
MYSFSFFKYILLNYLIKKSHEIINVPTIATLCSLLFYISHPLLQITKKVSSNVSRSAPGTNSLTQQQPF